MEKTTPLEDRKPERSSGDSDNVAVNYGADEFIGLGVVLT